MANDNSGVEKSSISLIKFKHFTYKWTIDDFENLLAKDLKTNINGFKYVESDHISPPNDDRVQFKIQLYPNGDREESKNYVSIYLFRVSSVDKSNDVYFKISILNENNEKCNVNQIRYTFENSKGSGWHTFISRAQLLNLLNGLLCNGKLTLLVEINVAENEALICESQNYLPNSLENIQLTRVIKLNKFSYKWKIEDFNSISNTKATGTFVDCPKFNSPRNDQAKFFLRLYPNGLNGKYKDCLSLFLGLETSDKIEVTVQHKFAILDRSNEQLFCRKWMGKLKKDTIQGSYNFITKNELLTKASEILPEGTLTIICELQVFEDEFLCKEILKENPISQVTSILDNLNSSSNNTSSKTYTHLDVVKFGHTWTIDNFKVFFDEQLSEKPFLESEQFFSPNDNPIRFNLRIYPRGYEKRNEKFVSIFLILANCEQRKATVECRITIANAKEEKCFPKGMIVQRSDRSRNKTWLEQFIQRDILLNQENEFLSKGKLTIFCEVGIVGDSKANFENLPSDQTLPSVIGQDFGRLLDSGEYSDVVFVVEGQEIKAHKAFLASRSDYFSKMLRSNMRESNENLIEITDIGFEVFRDLLSYIYNGTYQPKNQNIQELFIAANKYNLENLEKLCEDSLCSLVNRDTVAEYLIFTKTFNAKKLKTTVLDFINLQAPWLMKDKDFTSKLVIEDVIEIYNDMIEKQNFR